MVTDRNRVVAELVPPRTDVNEIDANAKWAEAVRLGHITPAKDRNAPLPPRTDPIMTFEEMMADLDEARADRDIP